MPSFSQRCLLGLAAGALLAGAGCRSVPPMPAGPLSAPAVALSVAYQPGAPLSHRAGALPEKAEHAHRVVCTLMASEKLPADALGSCASLTRLVTTPEGETPIAASARLTRSARAGFLSAQNRIDDMAGHGDFGRTTRLPALEGVLPPGVTLVFRAQAQTALPHPELGDPVHESVEVRLYRNGAYSERAGFEVALVVEAIAPVEKDHLGEAEQDEALSEGETPDRAKAVEAETSAQPPVLQKEAVVLVSPPSVDADQIILVFPSPFEAESTRALTAVIELSPAPAEGPELAAHKSAFQVCRDQVARSLDQARRGPPAPRVSGAAWPGLAAVIRGLAFPVRKRQALIYLADATGARFTADATLTAPDDVIQPLGDAVLKEIGQCRDPGGLAWILEKTTYVVLARIQKKAGLPLAMQGVLAQHAGELGRQPGFLEEVVAETKGLEAFGRRLVEENRLYLEDSSPAARTRAYDWLRARHQAPAGYNPLDPVRKRKAALERAEMMPAGEKGDGHETGE